jgi:outer membrane protein assembly factor BamB
VTDGRRVYVYFGTFGLVCYDFAGREQWRVPLPVPVNQHGAGASPVIAGRLLVLACDQDVGSHLLALDRRTGRQVWRTERPAFRRSFSTPLLWPAKRPNLVILPGTLRLVAYHLRTGAEAWSLSGLPNEMVSSPAAGDGLVFVAGWTPGAGVARLPAFDALLAQGDRDRDGRLARDEAPSGPAQQHFNYIDADKDHVILREEWDSMARIFALSSNVLLAARPDGQGEVTETHTAWTQTRGLPYVPSPLYYEGRVYLVKNGGLASCFEARTGRVLYQEERVGALGDYYASPIAANGKVCLCSQAGVVTILKAGDTLEVLARNPLDEPVTATPAVSGDRLYVRTAKHLFAFGSTP